MSRKPPDQPNPPTSTNPLADHLVNVLGFTPSPSNPHELTGRCPHPDHDDTTPSFGFNLEKGAFHCFGCDWSGNGRDLAAHLGIPYDGKPAPSITQTIQTRIFVYAKDGKPLRRKVREDGHPDGKHCYWQYPGPGPTVFGVPDWVHGQGDAEPIIYNYDAVRAAAGTAKPVLFVEGEPKADLVTTDGFVGTTVGGVTSWLAEHAAQLAGCRVVLFPDWDEPGHQHMVQVATAILPYAASVSWLDLPGLGPKEDVVDWRQHHGAAELRKLIKGALGIRSIDDIPPSPHAVGSGIVVLDVGAGELAASQFRPREQLISPIIDRQGLAMLWGWRGVLKTQLAIGMSVAASSGTPFLRFGVQRPCRVLYIDGELQGWRIQELFAQALGRLPAGTVIAPGCLRLITPDAQPALFAPNLAAEAAQRLLVPHLDGVDLLVIDNLSALWRGGDENDASDWDTTQAWLLSLRQRGLAVLLLHHANKAGDQRGTSRREDLLDTVIKLRRPDGYNAEDGAWAAVEFTKSRSFWGDDAAPFEVWFDTTPGGLSVWRHGVRAEVQAALVRDAKATGQSVRKVAKTLGMSKSKAHRLLHLVPDRPTKKKPKPKT